MAPMHDRISELSIAEPVSKKCMAEGGVINVSELLLYIIVQQQMYLKIPSTF